MRTSSFKTLRILWSKVCQYLKKGNKSVLMIRPDFHCSFFYRDELRRNSWVADIFVPSNYPKDLLYSSEDIIRPWKLSLGIYFFDKYINYLINLFFIFLLVPRYQFVWYYGISHNATFLEKKLEKLPFFGKGFLLDFTWAKLFNTKIIFSPSGCKDQALKEEFNSFEGGNVCGNCGYSEKCDDVINLQNLISVRRYSNFSVGWDPFHFDRYNPRFFRYKSIDLRLWNPNISVPDQFVLPQSKSIRVLHSNYLKKSGRNHGGKNIKGSLHVESAIEALKADGYDIEYLNIQDVKSKDMKYIQIQADIVVDQLIYGWWGSTAVESMALGKPVICFLRPSWKKFFLNQFTEISQLPIVEANASNIYDVLKNLVTDACFRERKGKDSRKFAEENFDPQKNVVGFTKILEQIK